MEVLYFDSFGSPRCFIRSIKPDATLDEMLSLFIPCSFHPTTCLVILARVSECLRVSKKKLLLESIKMENERGSIEHERDGTSWNAKRWWMVVEERGERGVREVLAKYSAALCVKLTYLRQSPRAVPVFCLGTSGSARSQRADLLLHGNAKKEDRTFADRGNC